MYLSGLLERLSLGSRDGHLLGELGGISSNREATKIPIDHNAVIPESNGIHVNIGSSIGSIM